MAKSYKKETMELLNALSEEHFVAINGIQVPVYSKNFPLLVNTINLQEIVRNEHLSGKTKPVAIIQYGTINPMDMSIIPMVAFVWSWGGPWAFIYNIQYPSWSESGSVPLHRVSQFAGRLFNSTEFTVRER